MPKGHLNQLYRGTIVYRIRISKKREREKYFHFVSALGYFRLSSLPLGNERIVAICWRKQMQIHSPRDGRAVIIAIN